MLVLDASVVLRAVQFQEAFKPFRGQDLFAPPHMWSEVRSALHETVWRGESSPEQGRAALLALEEAPIRMRTHQRLGEEAWRIADELGWAKTYDAEYVALAALLGCRLVTADNRLRRGAERLGFVITPGEL